MHIVQQDPHSDSIPLASNIKILINAARMDLGEATLGYKRSWDWE